MTKEQFFKEVLTLRNLFGTKTFWDSPQTVRLARKGIAFAYFKTECDNDKDTDYVVSTFQATMGEFMKRAMMMGVDLITGESDNVSV